MLKNILKKYSHSKEVVDLRDIIKNNIVDGYVDVKAYKKGEMVYHDAGDNVVTDWMRHAIMIMLTGDSFSKLGNTDASNSLPINTINTANHTKNETVSENLDGYILNGSQYFWDGTDYKGHYSKSDVSVDNIFPFFPTKVLFGTGKEYASWKDLENDTNTLYPSYYDEYLNLYGNSAAELNFNGEATGVNATIQSTINHYSSSLANNTYSGSADLIKTRTVNDPFTEKVINPSSTLHQEYGITGAIKTPYFNKTTDVDKLEVGVDPKGKLLDPKWRGVGRPAFIYLNTPEKNAITGIRNEDWADPTSGAEVILTRDSSKKYLEKITFTITMPEQSGATELNAFYPYNGFTLKQIGLFSDSRLSYTDQLDNTLYQYKNMPCGIMLAKKHIAPFSKTADLRVVITWVLSI